MKPVAFDYARPSSVSEVLTLLERYGADAKIMAGGQSLVPMLNFRVVRPAIIIDVAGLVELDYQRPSTDGALTIGALTRHRTMETSPVVAERFPVIPAAMRHVAHLAIRNRGTIGGSLSHADPAAEWPMLARLLDARLRLESVRGSREVDSSEFFVGALTTALAEDEMLTRVELPPLPPGSGWAFDEVAKRAGDFALAAVAALVRVHHERITMARVAVMGIADTPIRLPSMEAELSGAAATPDSIRLAAIAAAAGLSTRADLHASSDFRRMLSRTLLIRVTTRALERALALTPCPESGR